MMLRIAVLFFALSWNLFAAPPSHEAPPVDKRPVVAAVGAAAVMTFPQLAAEAAAWVKCGLQVGAIRPLASMIFGEIGANLGMTAEWVAQNWATIGPSLQTAHLHLRVFGPNAGFVLGRAAAYAPTVLFAVVAAGLIPPAILKARIKALETSAKNEAREWQMDRAVLADTFRENKRDGLRVPSMVNTADIILAGPGSADVSDQLFQNYLNAAFVARRNPTDQNVERATTLLKLIQGVVSKKIDD